MMAGTLIPDNLITLYRETDYHVRAPDSDFVLHVDERSAQLAEVLASAGHRVAVLITAENPFSNQLSAAENEVRQVSLRSQLHDAGAMVLDACGVGADPIWREASFLALGIGPEEGARLGQNWGQNAILAIDDGATPRLILLRLPGRRRCDLQFSRASDRLGEACRRLAQPRPPKARSRPREGASWDCSEQSVRPFRPCQDS